MNVDSPWLWILDCRVAAGHHLQFGSKALQPWYRMDLFQAGPQNRTKTNPVRQSAQDLNHQILETLEHKNMGADGVNFDQEVFFFWGVL